MLLKTIKKNLKEAAETKQSVLTESKIIESRLSFLIQKNIKSDIESLTEDQKIKLFFKLGEEISFYQNSKFLNESILDALGKIIFSGAGETLFEKLSGSVLRKIGITNPTINGILSSLVTTDPSRLRGALTDCKELTKLIGESIIEGIIIGQTEQNSSMMGGLFQGTIRNVIGDAVRQSDLGQQIENKLAGTICSLFSKYTDKAKEVMSKKANTAFNLAV